MISISDIDVDNANIFITLLGNVQIICVLPLFPTGKNFYWNLNFAIYLIDSSLNLTSAYSFL